LRAIQEDIVHDETLPVTVAEWLVKMPRWELHDVEGWLIAVPAGTLWAQAATMRALHAVVCAVTSDTDDYPLHAAMAGRVFDEKHSGWTRGTRYNVHFACPAETLRVEGEYLDTLARQCGIRDEHGHDPASAERWPQSA
jgi:hypothetical protein